MKKLLFVILFFSCINIVFATEKVPVYVITKDGCVNCENAVDYFEKLAKDNEDLFTLTVFDIFDEEWNFKSQEYETFFNKLMTSLEESTDEFGTPVIVIGNYHNIGLPKDREILYEAIKQYQKEEQTDPVKEILDEMNMTIEQLKESKVEKKDDNHNGIIMLSIFGVIILAFVGLLVFPKK